MLLAIFAGILAIVGIGFLLNGSLIHVGIISLIEAGVLLTLLKKDGT